MPKNKNILICADRGVGKSTLIQKLLVLNNRPVGGFITKRGEADETGFHPIYINRASSEFIKEQSNMIGTCDSKTHNVNTEVFNTLGTQYINETPKNGIIIMDELGFMESMAKDFTKAVFDALDSDMPVIAAVKSRYDVQFLNDVRANSKSYLFIMDENNRDEAYDKLSKIVMEWNERYRYNPANESFKANETNADIICKVCSD